MAHLHDFIALSTRAMAPEATMDDKGALFRAFLGLDEWIFISPYTENLDAVRPFISVIDGQQWVFAFTDSQLALQFGKANHNQVDGGFLNPAGEILYLSMTVPQALPYLERLGANGIYGMQINFGMPGWFVPLAGIPGIVAHLGMDI
jgi:hypothetical protein